MSGKELLDRSPQITYRGRNLDEIAFPLGGIGTGMVSLGGWGQLRDWEIMNRPCKGGKNPQAFFTLACRRSGKPARHQDRGNATTVRVLQGPVGGTYGGDGHTISREAGEGLPHFREVSFTGRFPMATVELSDPAVPVAVTLEAFNPFIPLNEKDSGIPAAILVYRLKNVSRDELELFVCGNLTNTVGDKTAAAGRANEERRSGGLTGLFLTNRSIDPDAPEHGSLVLAALAGDAAVLPHWEVAHRSVQLAKFWDMMHSFEGFPPRLETAESDTGTVGVSLHLGAGQETAVPFVVGWHFPNFEHWNKEPADGAAGCCGEGGACSAAARGKTWKNHYVSVWGDAWEAAVYTAENLERLDSETRLFCEKLFSSTVPSYVLDAVSSQISVLKTPTCLRLQDGTFYGFEGCNNTSGCCEGSCTHVWNYAQALPYLFPGLQRSIAEAHFANSMMEDGFVQFRMPLPLGTRAEPTFHPAADGQMGCVMQIYREWLISGDRDWLEKVWPDTKGMLEFAWKYWDADRDGVMEGMQHNTYDIEFHGPNTMTGSLYLGALRAGEELAREMGEEELAREYRELFEKGAGWTDSHLFNGEYYEQEVREGMEEPWPENLRQMALRRGRDDRFSEWPRWQYGKGCISDQLIGQWYARMLHLGDLYDPAHMRTALESVFRYNWREDLTDHANFLRIYAVDGEAGLLVGTWPKGGRPGYGFYFSDEVWCGIEYQVAAHMIYEGMIEEGLSMVRGLRERFRGDRRNPWDEFECGHHYARSMASYSLLLALSGFRYVASEGRIGIDPKVFAEDFRCFFSVGSAWGVIGQKQEGRGLELTVEVSYGDLRVRSLEMPAGAAVETSGRAVRAEAAVDGRPVPCRWDADASAVILEEECGIAARQCVRVVLSPGGASGSRAQSMSRVLGSWSISSTQ